MHRKSKILFIGDPLSSLKLASDTSLAFCEAALELNFSVFWCEKKDIVFFDREIYVTNLDEITHVSLDSLKYKKNSNQSTSDQIILFSEFQCCFIRTDPPFDESYKDLCWILNSQTKVKVYNSPAALLQFHEKTFPWRAYSEGVINKENLIPTCVSTSLLCVQSFLKTQQKIGVEKFVTKPWLGFAGSDVLLWDNIGDLLEHVGKSPYTLMVQPLIENIHTVGDRRVMIVDGQIHWSFVRIPSEDAIVSNLARGGTALLSDMTDVQLKLCEKIGKFLVKHCVVIAGIDLIGEKIGEINITSPTGFRAYEKISGIKVSKSAFEKILLKKF